MYCAVTHDLNDCVAKHGAQVKLSVPQGNSVWTTSPDASTQDATSAAGSVTLEDTTFMDDEALFLSCESWSAMAAGLPQLLLDIDRVYRKWGLLLNWEVGKSELLVIFAGPGSRKAPQLLRDAFARVPTCPRRRLRGKQRPPEPGATAFCVPFVDDEGVRREVKIVASYKHVGAVTTALATMTAELNARVTAARTTSAALRPLLRDRHIRAETKLRLLNSLVISRLLYGSEAWSGISVAMHRRIQSVVMREVRRAVGCCYTSSGPPSDGVAGPSDEDLLKRLGWFTPDTLRRHRRSVCVDSCSTRPCCPS